MKTIEEIRAAFLRIHNVAAGKSRDAYMSIPARPDHDADLIVMAAIDELAQLRAAEDAALAELREKMEKARECVETQMRVDSVKDEGAGRIHTPSWYLVSALAALSDAKDLTK